MGTVAQRFYHSTTEQDFTASGEVDIRKLLETAPGSNATTICTHPNAAGTTDITLNPYTNSSTSSDIRANCGWAINRLGTDGIASDATAKKYIASGTWTFTTSVAIPSAGTLTGTLTVSNLYTVYRVSSSGARTALFTATSNTVTSAILAGANSGVLTATVNPGEILLEPDETLHVGILSHMVQVASTVGATVTGVATYTLGTSVQYVEVASPGILTRYIRSFSSTMIGLTTRLNYIKPISKVGVMLGIASINRFTQPIAKIATMLGIATRFNTIKPIAKIATMLGVATRFNTIKPIAKIATMLGVATRNNYVKPIAKVAIMVGVAVFSRALEMFRVFTATMLGVTGFARALIAVRSFSTEMVGLAVTYLKIPQVALNRIVGGGGTTIIRKIFGIFD
jgi:hypothetical protein